MQMINENKTEACFYISKRKERLVIDEEVKMIVEILDDIIIRENELWLKSIYQKVKRGNKDIYIIMDSPLSKGKYYVVKSQLVNKIYDCCICRGLVTYEEILNEVIG